MDTTNDDTMAVEATPDAKATNHLSFDGTTHNIMTVTCDDLRDTDTIINDNKVLLSKVERNLVMRKKVSSDDDAEEVNVTSVDPDEYDEKIHQFVVVDSIAPGDRFKCKIRTSVQHYVVLRMKTDADDPAIPQSSTLTTATSAPLGEKRGLDDRLAEEPVAKKKIVNHLRIRIHGKGMLKPGRKQQVLLWIVEDLGVAAHYKMRTQPNNTPKWAYYEDDTASSDNWTKSFACVQECVDHIQGILKRDFLTELNSIGAESKFKTVYKNIDDSMFDTASGKAKSARTDDDDGDVFTM